MPVEELRIIHSVLVEDGTALLVRFKNGEFIAAILDEPRFSIEKLSVYHEVEGVNLAEVLHRLNEDLKG